jgi:hypothetical protein
MNTPTREEMCRCWMMSPPLPHEGHCCFMDDPTPTEDMVAGMDLVCGHWHPEVPRPELAFDFGEPA